MVSNPMVSNPMVSNPMVSNVWPLRQVESSSMGTHTGSTPHWVKVVDNSSIGNILDQHRTGLKIAL